jgi:hypothetical protein
MLEANNVRTISLLENNQASCAMTSWLSISLFLFHDLHDLHVKL